MALENQKRLMRNYEGCKGVDMCRTSITCDPSRQYIELFPFLIHTQKKHSMYSSIYWVAGFCIVLWIGFSRSFYRVSCWRKKWRYEGGLLVYNANLRFVLLVNKSEWKIKTYSDWNCFICWLVDYNKQKTKANIHCKRMLK